MPMDFDLNCPLPLRHETIQMAHGGGGRIMRELLEGVMLPAFRNDALDARHAGAQRLDVREDQPAGLVLGALVGTAALEAGVDENQVGA